MTSSNFTAGITGVVQSFENRIAIIRLDDGQLLRLPIDALEPAAKVGSSINLSISGSTGDASNQSTLARAILNEVLQGSKPSAV